MFKYVNERDQVKYTQYIQMDPAEKFCSMRCSLIEILVVL